jgi:hypothetical protein
MRRTFRYDEKADMFYEVGDNFFEERKESGPNIISDDVGAGVNGLRHMPSGRMLDSKSEHRKETKRRGLEEVGNETNFAAKREQPTTRAFEAEVNKARQQIAGDYNGTRGWLERTRERGTDDWKE